VELDVHPKHQPAIFEAWGRGDQEKGMVAILEIKGGF
jgi:hypothetical protein